MNSLFICLQVPNLETANHVRIIGSNFLSWQFLPIFGLLQVFPNFYHTAFHFSNKYNVGTTNQ